MMPGENQSGAGEVGSEATSGTCQNCTVLNQSLDEYVAALLTLKQKIIDTDLLLSEYKEKCDELQKSQRESTKLHKELDEVLLKLGPLEKQTAEYEAVRAELQETTAALNVYQVKSEEVDGLREKNLKALAMNAKLEESLKKAKDAANTQSLENSKLTAEKKLLESDLQKTQESLRLSQTAVEEAEGLKLQNAKSLILVGEFQVQEIPDTKLRNGPKYNAIQQQKSNLENQLLALEDINLKQNHTIQELKNKNSNLEKSNRLIEEKYATMEKEFNKEKSCASTQTENESKVDKAKIWTLLQEVWHCVDPLSKTAETLGSNDNHCLTFRPPRSPCPLSVSPFRKQMPQSPVSSPKGAKVSPETSKSVSLLETPSSPTTDQKTRRIGRKKKRSSESTDLNESCTKTDEASDSSLNKDGPVDCVLKEESCRKTPDIWEILSLSHPLPAPISPLPPDELDEMEVDASLRECSDSKAEDGQKPQSTEPKPLDDSVAVFSPVSSDTENKNQETQVENMCKITKTTEDSPCTVATASVPNESDGECVSFNPVTVISTNEERTDQRNGKSLCNGGHEVIKDTNFKDGVRQSLEPVQQVTLPEESPEKDDKSVQNHSEVKACVPGSSSPQTCSKTEPERTEEEIQNVLTLQTNAGLKSLKDHNSSGGQHSESSCTVLNVTSGDSSDEEEFLGLKRKVRGNCLRPGDLDGVNSKNPVFNETQECVNHVQGTHAEAEEEHNRLEKENDDGHVSDGSIILNMCKPVILEDVDVLQETGLAKKDQDESENCLNNSLPNLDAHSQEENGVLSRSFSPKTDMNGCLKEDGAKPKDSPNKSEDICPASSVNTLTPSVLDNLVNLPLTKVASRNALTSPLSPESIRKVLTEMGPPLPPVVLPLTATPPKFKRHLIQNRPSIQLPTWSSTEGPFSFNHQSKAPSPDPSLQEEVKTPLSTTTPSPSRGVPSSPLQFGSATPKHALPVPGRLPSSALNSSSPSASQENSMQMLDTMYPELSAQARTLNILRGNVNLGRAANERGVSPPPINPISGNKTINSSSTAFTKTDQKAKRIGANVLLPKSAKRLRLDTCSPDPVSLPLSGGANDDKPSNGVASPKYSPVNGQSSSSQTAGKESKAVGDANDTQSLIFSVFEKLENSCFDVLPVIKSHVFLGRISDIPVLRDEEKCVIADFCSNQSLAEELMLAVLSKIKEEGLGMKHELLQSYCRVYVGLCRWRGDCQKAHALAYSLLKEDFPEAPKLILFMVTTWPTVLSHDSSLCRAIHIVSKLKAEGETLDYLSKYLHWDEMPPGDIHKVITSILKALLEDSTLTFQKHDRHGDDLCPASWEYIVSLDLLCAHLGWKWTHDNIIGKELWPVMNAWVTQPRSQQTPVRDICVAAVLRLIGRLGQLGLKEKLCMSVQNVAKAINLFGKHGISEGVPWEVQLSAVYTIYDLAPSNPKEALEALASWRGEIRDSVPPAVTSCLTQIGSLCRQLKQ